MIKNYKKKTFLAIIPARGNSKRLPLKNLKKIGKKTLIDHSILTAKNSNYISNICVTSDSEKILDITKKYKNIIKIKRPKYLSNDKIMPDAAIIHAYKKIRKIYDYIVTLQPTSPLRTSKQIDEAIKKIVDAKADSLVSVCKSHDFYWKKKKFFFEPQNYDPSSRPRSQDSQQYRENGLIYISSSKKMLKTENRLFGNVTIYETPKIHSIDIDDKDDLTIANYLYKNFF